MLQSPTWKVLIAACAVAVGVTAAPTPPSAGETRGKRHVHVKAPHARVYADADGRVRVKAPYTRVYVDPDRGHVHVRAPYVNLSVNW